MADPTLPVSSTPVAPVNRGEAAPVNKGEMFTSFDVEAFEVPSPREEVWRFTPFRRLRGLHDGSAQRTADPVFEISGTGEGVTVETVGRD
ncbi:Fe-S cluster assembly protein SufD, partial [Streptomyces sp. SID10244]|nr:Fe-S cluster assembly protein SufD [Streptomyces sp. SID10244]